ncbi:MAG: adenylate/guanylate cyclase domain-containing protein [Spirochaetia bacterium]|jgi:adenylate cyclase|nr:adenylate/guanylate cyclase domain-containing protein [Spirochaetia bacterium]
MASPNDNLLEKYKNLVEHSTLNENDLEKANVGMKKLLNSMKKYLSPQLFNSIVNTPAKDLDLSYERKKLTIFFSDIVGFTQITDMIEPESLSSLLNEYLDEMSRIAEKYGGTIDKFIGDAIMIFFGDSDSDDEYEPGQQCVRMALEMMKKTEALSKGWLAKGSPSHLKVRMGINTGFCTVGNFGSSNRMDYTIIGGQVNIASRLEKISDENSITISNSTYKLVKDIVVVEPPVSKVIKGISHPIEVYKLIRLKDKDELIKNEYCITTKNGFTSQYRNIFILKA